MRKLRPFPRRAVDELLDGSVRDPDRLVRVLDAARAPGTAAELGGLDAALAAFVSLAGSSAPAPSTERAPAPVAVAAARRRRRRRRRRPMFVKGLTAATLATKLVAGAAAAAAAGGVALAAVSTHDAPRPHPHVAISASGSTTHAGHRPSPSSRRPHHAGDGGAGTDAAADPTRPLRSLVSSAAASGAASTSPALLVSVCTAWLAHEPLPGVDENSPRFAAAVHAAGGAKKVTEYCAQLLAARSASATGSATPPTSPSDSDTGSGPSSPSDSSGYPTGSESSHGQPGGDSDSDSAQPAPSSSDDPSAASTGATASPTASVDAPTGAGADAGTAAQAPHVAPAR